MKKMIAMFLSLTFILSFVGCNQTDSNEKDMQQRYVSQESDNVIKPSMSSKDDDTIVQDNTLELTENRVVGLISNESGGNDVVKYNTTTWEYQIIMELPDVTPDNYVAMSLDEKKLAYTSWSENYTTRYLNVIDIASGENKIFFNDMPLRNEIIKISWMPDNVSVLYIRNDTNTATFQTVEYINTLSGEITTVDHGEVWKIRQMDFADQVPEPYVLPGSEKEIGIKYSEKVEGGDDYWYYYMDEDDLREIYKNYGGVREFDFSTILNYMSVIFSAPRCSKDGGKIIYSTILERNSAPGRQTPLWVAAAVWMYDVKTGEKEMIHSQEDEGAIGRVDWLSESEICYVTYYDYQGSRDNINYLNLETDEQKILFHYTDEFYNNVTLLPVGNRKITFTSSSKDSLYSESKTYILDVDTKLVEQISILYEDGNVIMENFVFY